LATSNGLWPATKVSEAEETNRHQACAIAGIHRSQTLSSERVTNRDPAGAGMGVPLDDNPGSDDFST
jgi:hypothetical protein